MSDDYNTYDTKKRKPSKGRSNGYKGGKGVRVYFEVKQGDDRATAEADKNYDRDDGDYQHRSNGTNYRQGNNRQYENNYNNNYHHNHNSNYYKNNGYNQKSSKREQPVYRKKRENFVQVSKEDALERYDQNTSPNKGFSEIIEENPQVFTKEPLKPVSIGFKAFDMRNDDCLNATTTTNDKTDSKPFSNGNDYQHHDHTEKESRAFVRWDDGGDEDIFGKIDMKSRDAELRGRKPAQQSEEKGKKEFKPYEGFEESKARNNRKLEDYEDEKPIEWDASEEQGEFSNIDMIFEQKMKSNVVNFDEDETDDLCAPQEDRFAKATFIDNDDEDAPVWGDVDVNDVKKTTNTMDNVFFKNNEKQNRSYDRTTNSPSTFETSYNGKELSQNSVSNSSRFEKMFVSNSSDELSSPDSRNSGSKMPVHNSMNNRPMENQYFTFEQQQELLKQQQEYFKTMMMQAKANEMESMRYNTQAMPSNDLNRQLIGGNKSPIQNHVYNPYQQQQLNAVYNNQQNYVQIQNKQIQNINQQKIQIKIFEKFSGSAYEKKTWYYVDRNGKRQGPFSGKEMDDWYREGYLPGDLIVTFGENNGYRQLQELVKKVEESLVRPNVQQQQPQHPAPNLNKLLPNTPNMPNLANLTSFQLSEFMKNPDFVQNAKKHGYDLNRLLHSLMEREANEKQNKSWSYNNGTQSEKAPVITGTFDSQGVYYPVNTQNYSNYGNIGYGAQYPNNKSGYGTEDADLLLQRSQLMPDSGYVKQGMSQNISNSDYQQQLQQNGMNNVLSNNISSKGYPLQQQQQQLSYQYTNQGYSPNVYGNNILSQNPVNVSTQSSTYTQSTVNQTTQQGVNSGQSNGGASPDQLTSQLKSLLGVNGGLGDLMGGITGFNKEDQRNVANLNSYDFPPLN